jgi:hypothetical protein
MMTPPQHRRGTLTGGLILFLASLLLSGGEAEAQEVDRPADHVILVSIDGFRPDFYLDERWPAPMLQQMAREGASAEGVRAIFPSVTFPAHTTLVTGVGTERHRVLYNTLFQPEGPGGIWYWDFDAIAAPTLWEIVSESGGTTASLLWPVTRGAPIDWNLPEVWDHTGELTWPEMVGKHASPEGFLEEVEREATGRLPGYAFSGGVRAREDWMGAIGAYVIGAHQPTFMTVHLLTTDSHQHQEGREGPGVHLAVAAVDRALARMVEAADRAGILDRTTFVVSGDHGFVDVHHTVAPNIWLVDAGLRGEQLEGGGWRATFQSTSGGAFLHLRDPDDRAAADEARRAVEEHLPEFDRFFRVVGRDELDRLGVAREVPFALAARRGVSLTGASTGAILRAGGGGGSHGYAPDFPDIHTGFVAWGAGVRAGARIPEMNHVDVAPIAAAFLGLTIPESEGIALPGILER